MEEDEPETADIIMIGPPTGGDNSDMEMDDDNSLPECGLPDEVAGEFEVQQYYAHDTSKEESDDDDAEEVDAMPSAIKKKKRKKKAEDKIKWTKAHIESKESSSSDQDSKAQALLLENPILAELTMFSSFELVFSDMIELLVNETNRYANRDKNNPSFQVSAKNIFLSGYKIRKSERDYWSTDPHLRCDAFVVCMSRNGFFKIKSFLHAADNQSLHETRMAKVNPLYNILNGKLNMFGVVHEDLSIDESHSSDDTPANNLSVPNLSDSDKRCGC